MGYGLNSRDEKQDTFVVACWLLVLKWSLHYDLSFGALSLSLCVCRPRTFSYQESRDMEMYNWQKTNNAISNIFLTLLAQVFV